MATPPALVQFKKEDFGSDGLGDQKSLDRFFVQLNKFVRDTSQTLDGGITFSANTQCELKTINITTPATDWVSLSMTNGWVTYGTANSGGAVPYSPPMYRIAADGQVEVSGLIKAGTLRTVVNSTLLPVPSRQKIFPAVGSTGVGDSFARVDVYTNGTIQVMTVGSTTSGALSSGYVSLDSIRYRPANPTPGILSCFPVTISTTVSNPTRLLVGQVYDTSSSPSPLAAGLPSWVSTSQGVQLQNLPGLLLGRTYQVNVMIIGE